MAFRDYRKAVDYGEQKFVLQALKNQGVQDKYGRIIKIVYNHSYEKIKMDSEVEKFRLEREGKHFHHKYSLVYWNTYSEIWSKKDFLNFDGGKVNKLRFAD
jgi:hypothetical protein